jgi:hypothetical protein
MMRNMQLQRKADMKIRGHFGGEMLTTDREFWALACENRRYAASCEQSGLARDADFDWLMARFAVAQRRRLAIWQ